VEAAEAVCDAPESAMPLQINVLDGLSTLVEQSLVQPRTDKEADEPRFGMLQVIREYARERLEKSGEAEALHRAHATYLLTEFEPEYYLQVMRQHGTEWIADVELEYDNVRAALTWACDHKEMELGLRLAASVAIFWIFRRRLREGRAWLETLVALGVGSRMGEERVRGVEAVEAVTRRAGLAAARAWVYALEFVGLVAANQGEREEAAAVLEESVVAARALGDMTAVSAGLHFLGINVFMSGDIARGVALLEDGIDLARQLVDKLDLLTAELTQYGSVLMMVPGEEDRAISMMEESLELAQRMDIAGYGAVPRLILARVARHRGDLARASMLMSEALRLVWDYDLTFYVPGFLNELALIAEGQGQVLRAAQLLGAATHLFETFETTGLPPDPMQYPDVEAMKVRGQAVLGEEAWAAAYAAGLALPLEDAIAQAQVASQLTSMGDSQRSQ
jgi:hypothetical protein